MVSEASVQNDIRLEAARRGATLWRNNSGACMDDRGNMIRYGLGNTSEKINRVFKSSDLVGITQVVVTPDMVGKVLGVFTGIECKAPGWKSPKNDRERAQENFINHIRSLGAIGAFAQDVKDVYP